MLRPKQDTGTAIWTLSVREHVYPKHMYWTYFSQQVIRIFLLGLPKVSDDAAGR